MEIAVVIPSHKRADRVKTTNVVANCKVCVPEAQVAAYREYNPGIEIVAHPDSVVGLPPKRDWIVEHFGDVFMVDDDIKMCQRQYEKPATQVSPGDCYYLIQETTRVARDIGAHLFGFANVANPLYYYAARPFRLTGWVNGFAMGVLRGAKFKFTVPAMPMTAEEDFLASCLNAYYHRYCFVDTRFAFQQEKTYRNVGGLGDTRTVITTEQDGEALKRLFGDVVVEKRGHRYKATHQHALEMRLPY